MAKSKANPMVDGFFREETMWRPEMEKLREIILGCGLTEDLKWGKPCYSVGEGNVVIIQGFKAYCALLFFKGVLMKDPNGILQKTGVNTRVGRQIRFTSLQKIEKLAPVLKNYIEQAVEVEKAGVKVELEESAGPAMPAELKSKLDGNRALKAAFEALTPGRQRAYIYFFAAPKQSETRTARIDKCAPQILKGRGLNDDYLARKK